MTNPSVQKFIDALEQQIRNAPSGVNAQALRDAIDAIKMSEPSDQDRVKIWFLLDRSGSMSGMAEDVISGFNGFLAKQGSGTTPTKMTLIQFDDQEPFEIVFDAQAVDQIPALTSDVFQPRGLTPLHDAIGRLISHADERIANRAAYGDTVEDQLVIVFTDGLENASRDFSRTQVFDLIQDRTAQDWTFAFMGTNQDSYKEGHKIGLVDGNVQNYDATGDSVQDAFESISDASDAYRAKPRRERRRDKGDFLKDHKKAEERSRREHKSG